MAESDDEFEELWDNVMDRIDSFDVEKLEKYRYKKHLEDLEKKGYN